MKKKFYLILILSSILSCNQNNKDKTEKNDLEPVTNVNDLLSDRDKWWSYQFYDISLSSDFKSLDTNFKKITKDQFLTELTSGKYVPVEMKQDSVKVYKLYEIPTNADSSIKSIIRNLAKSELHYYKLEGTSFPNFQARNLEEKIVDNHSLKGKTTVFKTWFIACKPCIAEMPELNKIVDNYQKDDFQFISLALDEAPELKKFLKSQEFKYAILPNQDELIQNKLKLNVYPTHLVVNKQGEIEKVFSKSSELIEYIETYKSVKLNSSNSKLPPPPLPPDPLNEKAINDE